MGLRLVRPKGERGTEFAVGQLPVPVVPERDHALGEMGIGERWVDPHDLVRRLPRLPIRDGRREIAIEPEHAERIGHAGVGERVSGIFRNGRLEELQSAVEAHFVPLVPVVAPLEIESVGLHVFGRAGRPAGSQSHRPALP